MNLTDIPDATIELKFDGLELYMLLDVSLTADQVWTIPLYPKTWPQLAGFSIGDQELGVVIGLDLVLELTSQVNMSTGVHISFDDGLAMQIAMFGNNVSTITLYVSVSRLRSRDIRANKSSALMAPSSFFP